MAENIFGVSPSAVFSLCFGLPISLLVNSYLEAYMSMYECMYVYIPKLATISIFHESNLMRSNYFININNMRDIIVIGKSNSIGIVGI